MERLLGFLEVGKPHVTAETMIQIKDLLRRYPDIAAACISSIAAVNLEVLPFPFGADSELLLTQTCWDVLHLDGPLCRLYLQDALTL